MMKVNAPLYHEQAQAGAGTITHIRSAVERREQVLLILRRYPDSLVANYAHGVRARSSDRELDYGTRVGIFHRVAQEISQDVSEQSFVCFRRRRNRVQCQFDLAATVGG